MEGFQKWWAALDRARRIMIIALTAMAVSQFMNYVAPYTRDTPVEALGMVSPNATLSGSTFNASTPMPGISGWAAHPYAWLILAALALLFAVNLDLGAWWKKSRYWVGVIGLTLCLFPFDMEDLPGYGLLLGLAAISIGIWAARAHARQTPA
jgi:hypothetical protein